MKSNHLENENVAKDEVTSEVKETVLEPMSEDGDVNIYKIKGAKFLNVRPRPSTNNLPKVVVDEFDELEVLNTVDDVWVKVKVTTMEDEPTGFAQSEFLKQVGIVVEEE